jgi:hypothetical protein
MDDAEEGAERTDLANMSLDSLDYDSPVSWRLDDDRSIEY